LIAATTEPLLVINGDILTSVDFGAMLSFHEDNGADMTVAVKQHEVQVPYGVVESDGVRVTRIVEKPTLRQFVSAGIYLINPDVPRSIPQGRAFDMPELIGYLISQGRLVASFPVYEYWIDIGRKSDYERAQRYAENEGV
jgi:NDP-sugar pyrophosphorylase family protein